ncbi:hypothetical protein CLV92_105245 [Kineococcus xinjiangensis]|uniref:Uncharacterized protein n=1 Tax=Kineococcus xinjiangensis TaxID=512762 RepID=A0A2S6IPH4_9ACTN|nr:hypothetical protein [Kineococcus xinjiangensis]PPK96143.1 hypothetical protein CLV92_105245 [Kineococcus xinjiangensis]
MNGDDPARRAGLIGPDGTATPRYAQYLAHQRQHQAALAAREEAYARALRDPRALQQWPMTGRAYQDAVDDAFDRWLSLGHKREVEAALDALRSPDCTRTTEHPSHPPRHHHERNSNA